MHTCNTCGKSFKFQSGLSRHGDTHKQEYKVHCTCGSMFSRSDCLKRHQLKCPNSNNNLDTSDDDCSTETTMGSHSEVKVDQASGLLENSTMEGQLTTIKGKRDIGTQTEQQSNLKASHCTKSKSTAEQSKNTCDYNDSDYS